MKENGSPETLLIPEEINLSGDIRLKSTVRLSWFGTDNDGFVTGYQLSINDGSWFATTDNDSTFVFDIKEGSDTADIVFKARAVDNNGNIDPTPAELIVPIKNSPPEIEVDFSLSSSDTAFLVASVFWQASDPDGENNLKDILIRINEADWVAIDKGIDNLTFVPENVTSTGPTSSLLYRDGNTDIATIDGLIMGDTNHIYVKSRDVSGAKSEADTIEGIFFKPKTGDLLVIGGDRDFNKYYRDRISAAYAQPYDFIDYTINDGQWQPTYWDPTFTLLIKQYDMAVIFSDKTQYFNANTGKNALILESSARSVQDFYNAGGKIMCVGYFPGSFDNSSNIIGIYPMDSVSSSKDAVFLNNGTDVVLSQETGYPSLSTSALGSAITPFYPSSDAITLYTGNLDKSSGWYGPDILGAKRTVDNKTYQVFIAVGLNETDGNIGAVNDLFDHVLNTEFNW
jgi:hypothetical protein